MAEEGREGFGCVRVSGEEGWVLGFVAEEGGQGGRGLGEGFQEGGGWGCAAVGWASGLLCLPGWGPGVQVG